MLIGNTFTYNGKSSQPYGLRFLLMNTEENREIGGVLEYATFQNNKSPAAVVQDTHYNSMFEFEVELISEHRLDQHLSDIYSWLLNQPGFRKLTVDDNGSGENYYYNCVFTNASYISETGIDGWGIYGIRATMKCDSTFLWKDVEFTYSSDELKSIVSHENRSDVQEYTYPTLIIKTGNTGGEIAVQNVSDRNRLTKFTDTLPKDTLTLSFFPALVTSYLNDNAALTYEAFNKNFFRLLHGINKIGITGDIAEITLRYKTGRLVR